MPERTSNLSPLFDRTPPMSCEDSKWMSTGVEQTHYMPARTQNLSKHVLIKPLSMSAWKQNEFKHVLTKPIPCQRRNKMHLNMCRLNNTNVARTQIVYQHVLTKPIQCQRRQKMNLNMCWPTHPTLTWTQSRSQYVLTNLSHASKDRKLILTCAV